MSYALFFWVTTDKFLQWTLQKKINLRGYSTLWNKNGVSFLTLNYFWALSFEKIANICVPCYATILLMLDSEGHKPKCNANNSCCVMQQHNKLLSDGPILSLMVHKQLDCIYGGGGGGGLMGLSPRPHVID